MIRGLLSPYFVQSIPKLQSEKLQESKIMGSLLLKPASLLVSSDITVDIGKKFENSKLIKADI